MGIFDRFKKIAKPAPKKETKKTKVKSEKKEKKQVTPRIETEVKETPPKKVAELKKSQTIEPSKILLKPIISEKATDLNARSQYVFEVAPLASKSEIAKAIVSLYGVRPVKINIINMTGKKIRYGRVTGKTKNWKKAVVTLKPEDKIEVYQGV
jgi:large subunit ribosomal protein L23